MQCVFCLDGLSLNLSGRQFSFDLGPTNQTQAGSDHVQYPHDSHSAGPGHQTGASGPQLPYSLLSFEHMIYQPSAARCATSQPLTAAQVVARSRPHLHLHLHLRLHATGLRRTSDGFVLSFGGATLLEIEGSSAWGHPE